MGRLIAPCKRRFDPAMLAVVDGDVEVLAAARALDDFEPVRLKDFPVVFLDEPAMRTLDLNAHGYHRTDPPTSIAPITAAPGEGLADEETEPYFRTAEGVHCRSVALCKRSVGESNSARRA